MQRQISVNLGNFLLSLSEVTDIANPTIAQHQQRTAFIALEIARYSSVDSDLIENLFTAALLHDIGAISIEEKMALHNFELTNLNLHCVRGELLLEQTPWLKKISKIVRYHHKNWKDWNKTIDNPDVFASQVVLLSDYIERLVDRNKYILHQNKEIIEKVINNKNTMVHEKIIDSFVEASKREEFWLDLVSPRIYPVLLHNGPYRNVEIDLKGIALIAEVYKDIIDFKSPFTATHTTGVSASAEMLSKLFGLTDIEINLMKIAGNLHDIGKLIIPNSILEKPDKLTTEEFAIIRCHTYYSYYVINTIGGLQQIAEWAAYHHEKLDGNGYPFHCKAKDIDTGARIMAVADIFTAISEDRPYRIRMNKEDVYKTIKNQSDKNLLDSRIVDLLFDNYNKVDIYVREKQAITKKFYENQFLKVIEQSK
jgi:HD-GYP domain-containing protein (c-di-GMP phosphodiesterase class II)